MFFRRGLGDAPDPWLQAKLWIFSLGAILALLGMSLRSDWLVGAAGVVLAAGLLLRFLPARRPPGGGDPESGSDGGDGA